MQQDKMLEELSFRVYALLDENADLRRTIRLVRHAHAETYRTNREQAASARRLLREAIEENQRLAAALAAKEHYEL